MEDDAMVVFDIVDETIPQFMETETVDAVYVAGGGPFEIARPAGQEEAVTDVVGIYGGGSLDPDVMVTEEEPLTDHLLMFG